MEQTRAPESFRGRPKQNDRVGRPGLLPPGISKTTIQFDDGFPVLPDGNRRAQFAKSLEVFLEESCETFAFHGRC